PDSYWVAMKYLYSDDDADTWTLGDDDLDHEIYPETNTIFNPYGHIIDVGNNTLYQTWFGGIPVQDSLSIYRMYLYKSTDGGSSFTEVIPTNDTRQPWGEPSMVNLGGGCCLILARMNDDINHFRQFKSEDNCANWHDQGATSFESGAGSVGAPPFLSFINYEGVGIVACYYTMRNTNPRLLKVVFGLAKDLLENGTSGWNNNTRVEIYNYPDGITMSGYQSFFLPKNQYKGIGITFKETASNSIAYPVIIFTKITGTGTSMHDVLTTLGL
ncbi:MAG TPA: sialidase family protein, partial [Bacteroidales bacterium]|nr:sialidase family protein [Bacteroidales bacterium]